MQQSSSSSSSSEIIFQIQIGDVADEEISADEAGN